MARRGKNPMYFVRRLAPPAPVTLTTVVHVPQLAGFWSESMEVLRLCLESLKSTASKSAELLVLDNGSCSEVREALEQRFAAGAIDQLILSHRNLGKVGAWNLLFGAAQGEFVSYTDSDVYFLKGWLDASLEVLEAFPEAGVVTAQAMSRDLELYCRATLEGAAKSPATEWTEGEDLVPIELVESHLRGLGETRESFAKRIPRRRDVRVRRRNVDAFVGSAHFQFTSRRRVLDQLFPLPTTIPFGDDNVFDERLDAAGFWRLSTVDYYAHHMGNRPLDGDLELPRQPRPSESSTEALSPPARGKASWRRRLLESRPVRGGLKRLNRWTYEQLYFD